MSEQSAQPSKHLEQPGSQNQNASLERIIGLLKAKDDTSRFVGLALLKSTLDSSEQLRNNKTVVITLWSSISAKFLDRLLRTGSKPGAKQADAKEMLDLAANVVYTFAILLPEEARADDKLLGRVPLLVNAIIQRYDILLFEQESTILLTKEARKRRLILLSKRYSQS